MDFRKIFLPLVILLAATALQAAEGEIIPPVKEPNLALINDVAEKTEPVIPKRELKFDVFEEEEPLTLQNVQEGMLDQRYVATFRFKAAKVEIPDKANDFLSSRGYWYFGVNANVRSRNNLPGRFNPAQHYIDEHETKFLRIQQMILSNNSAFSKESKGFSLLVTMIPEGHRPVKDMDTTFSSKDSPFIKSDVREDKDGNIIIQKRLLASTTEQAQQLVVGWLALYDWGLCYPAQKNCLNWRKKIEKQIAENNETLKKDEPLLSNLAKEEEKSKEFEDIKPESIVNLTTQRRMLSVDLAGIKAKIKVCQEILEKNLSRSRNDQVETTMISAEIELQGLNAKQAEIDRIIKGAQGRQVILRKRSALNAQVEILKSGIDREEKAIQAIEQYQLGYQPLPVEDGKVTIRRIKWVSQPKPEK